MTLKIRPRHLARVLPDGKTVAPSRFQAIEESDGRTIEMDVEVNDWGQARASRLTITDDSVTGETLRSVPVARLLKQATLLAASLMVYDGTEDGVSRFGPPSRAERREVAEKLGAGSRVSDDKLREVAHLYREAIAAGIRGPTSRLAADLDVSRSTAARWISEARKRGFLGKAKPGARGELP